MTIKEFYDETGYIPLFRINVKHGSTFKMNVSATIENLSGNFTEKIADATKFIRPFNKKWLGEPVEFTEELKHKVKDTLDKLMIPYEEKDDFIVVQSEESIITCYDPLLIPYEYSKLRPIFPDVMIFRKGSRSKTVTETIISLGYFSNMKNEHDHLAVITNGHINDWMDVCIQKK